MLNKERNMSRSSGHCDINRWHSKLDCLSGFDANGTQVFSRHRNESSFAGIQPHLDSDTSIKNAKWIPAAIKQEILASKEPQSWTVTINENNEPCFIVTIHSLGLVQSNICFLMEFDWVSRKANESDAVRSQLLQMARLACVGGLGGPIAHALNNPLATIRGFADVLKRRFSQVDKVGYFSDKIISNTERMRLTIEQLRNLSRARTGIDTQKPVHLNRVIEETMQIMDEQFKMRNIVLQANLGSTLPAIAGDSTLWESFFLSLFALSRDAFQTQNDDRKRFITLETKATEQGVLIRYADTSGRFPNLDQDSNADSLSMLGSQDSEFALPAFVILEVLQRQRAQFKVFVKKDESTELVVTLDSAADSTQFETDLAG
jgi:hypothetical protein